MLFYFYIFRANSMQNHGNKQLIMKDSKLYFRRRIMLCWSPSPPRSGLGTSFPPGTWSDRPLGPGPRSPCPRVGPGHRSPCPRVGPGPRSPCPRVGSGPCSAPSCPGQTTTFPSQRNGDLYIYFQFHQSGKWKKIINF